MTSKEQRAAVKAFAEEWKGRGYEKGESQPFWLTLTSPGLSQQTHSGRKSSRRHGQSWTHALSWRLTAFPSRI